MDDLTQLLLSQATISDPIRYANIIKATRSSTMDSLKTKLQTLRQNLENTEKSYKSAAEFRRHVSGDDYAQRRKKTKDMFDSLDKQTEGMYQKIDVSVLLMEHYNQLIKIYRDAVQGVELMTSVNIISYDRGRDELISSLTSVSDELGQERTKAIQDKIFQNEANAMQTLALEQKMNVGATTSFIQGVHLISGVSSRYINFLRTMSQLYEQYYERLRHRHSVEGIEIVSLGGTPSVSLTDVAILVWENVDRVGEIESGTDQEKLSPYTLQRANAMLVAAKKPDIWAWLLNPGKEIRLWAEEIFPMIKDLHEIAIAFKKMMGESSWELSMLDLSGELQRFSDVLGSLELDQINQKEPEQALNKTERFAVAHRNKSLKKVAGLLVYGDGTLQQVVSEILKLKVEEHKFFVHENSFYVCRIGSGSIFSGVAPGALEVIPGEKPNVNLNEIWGSGFEDIRGFIGGMKEAEKWGSLFKATSPSGSTDKQNILLASAPGTGKTQVLRAIASEKDSLAIFALGSNFGTAWANESQKNPHRLFEQAVKLHKSSGLHVYLLIDEVDSIFSTERYSVNRLDLTQEFQSLMDGVVAYEGISVVAATNFPEKIPAAMLRRFSKVEVVGELSRDNIKQILRHYIEKFLPVQNSDLGQDNYERWARDLDGAVGDVVRKVVDSLWLDFMRDYISRHQEEAERILDFIKEKHGENFEVSSLTDEERATIKQMIAEKVVITPEMVDEHVARVLGNLSVRQQIQQAKETFINAKRLLDKHKAGNKGIGFN